MRKGDAASGALRDMPNIGGTLAEKLEAVGVKCPADLKKLGSKKALSRIQELDGSGCYNMLCALEGAIQGVRWHGLPKGTRAKLLAYYQNSGG